MGIRNLFRNELFRGSLALLILVNFGSVINYFYHFSMARMLGAAGYGVLAVLTNIIYILGVPTISIRTVVSKKTTKFNSKKELGKIKGMFKYLMRELTIICLIIFLIFSLVSLLLSSYLGVDFWLLIFTGIFLFIAFWYSIGSGILQGMKKFGTWGINFVIHSGIKLLSAIILVTLGFHVYGAVAGFLLGGFLAFLLILPSIKEVLHAKEIPGRTSIFHGENFTTFLSTLIIVLIYSLDTILAKAFFSPEMAGGYAVISLTGKVILFSATSISNAMFPISSEKFFNGSKQHTRGVIKKTSIALSLLCGVAILFFAIFPEFVINTLFGSQYVIYSDILLYIGIAFSLISFLYALVLYRISIDEFKPVHNLILTLFLSIQVVLLTLFHSTIKLFSLIFMISTALTFFGSLLLLRRWK